MIRIQVKVRATGEPLKRTPVTVALDEAEPVTLSTDRTGTASFDLPPGSGKVLVNDVVRYQGRIGGDIEIGIWSVLEGSSLDERGAPGGGETGSTAYPSMQTRTLMVDSRPVETDAEGYLVRLSDWSEGFVRAQAAAEGLELTNQHWEIIRYLRTYYERTQVQCQVRDIIKHFRALWGPEQGSNRYLHDLFPRGGPQKQGNRLAGLLRTKGEH